MKIVKKIFSWKVFTVIYALLILLDGMFATIPTNIQSTPYNSFLNIIMFFSMLFAVGVCYAVGWKKKFFKNSTVAFGVILFIISIFLTSLQSALDSDFSSSSFYIFIYLFVMFGFMLIVNILPFIASVTYFVKSDEYAPVEKPFWKLYSIYFLVSYSSFLLAILYNKIIFDSIYDYINLIISFGFLIILTCYSWNIKLKNRNIVSLLSLLIIVGVCIPDSLYSQKFLDFSGQSAEVGNILGYLYVMVITVIQVLVIYRYAFTKEIYKSEE